MIHGVVTSLKADLPITRRLGRLHGRYTLDDWVMFVPS